MALGNVVMEMVTAYCNSKEASMLQFVTWKLKNKKTLQMGVLIGGRHAWEIADIGENDDGKIWVSMYPGPNPLITKPVDLNASVDFDGWIVAPKLRRAPELHGFGILDDLVEQVLRAWYPVREVIRSIKSPPWTIDQRGWVCFPYLGTPSGRAHIKKVR